MTLQELNIADQEIARKALLACCGSTRWVNAMAARRPFPHSEELHVTAQDLWWSLGEADWREAFATHPRIGETRSVSAWSAQEQKGMYGAGGDTTEAIATLNREYQERFGYIFIVCATGKTAVEMRSLLEQRLGNGPQEELRIAAAEQMKITHLRLDKLLQG